MTRVLPLLIALAGIYVAVCAAAVIFQERLVYFPSRVLTRTPADAGLAYEDVAFGDPGGPRLHGWLVPGGEVVALFCHGNAGNISDRIELIERLHALGLTVFIFDYAGYGRSEGRPTEAGTYRDAQAARRWLVETRGVDPSRLVYFGRSLGGAVAIGLAEREAPAALVVESTFSTLPDVGARAYPWLPVKLISRMRYDSVRRVKHLGCPVLVMHAPDDDVVPIELARTLYDAAAEPKRFVELQGGHGGGFLTDLGVYGRAWDEILGVAGLRQGGAPRDL